MKPPRIKCHADDDGGGVVNCGGYGHSFHIFFSIIDFLSGVFYSMNFIEAVKNLKLVLIFVSFSIFKRANSMTHLSNFLSPTHSIPTHTQSRLKPQQ